MQIILLEGFYSGSHQKWAEGLKKHSQHNITILSLPGRFWKWRMHGGAITLAHEFNKLDFRPDLILATDMIDLSVFLSLTRETTASITSLMFFHENQLTYPWSESDPDQVLQRNLHYAFINYHNALSADRILFNSEFHCSSFINALPKFLKNYPDHQNLESIENIRIKSHVLPVGIEMRELKNHSSVPNEVNVIPHILWNHRWEYDKNPELFFHTLFKLKKENIAFRLIVLGERTGRYPAIFDEARMKLHPEIVQWGHCPSHTTYVEWLHRADILPVSSNQDFFGISVVEAMACNTHPLLPNRLAYPEHVPEEWHDQVLWQDEDDFHGKLQALISHGLPKVDVSSWVEKYEWNSVADQFDNVHADKTR